MEHVTAAAPVTQDDLERLAYSFNDFGLHLLAQAAAAAPSPCAVAVAPIAIASGLAALFKGAGGATAAALAKVLHLDGAHGMHVNAIAHALLEDLRHADPAASLRTANSLWVDQHCPVAPDFTQSALDHFDTFVGAIDSAAPAAASLSINDWVRVATRDRLDPGVQPSAVAEGGLLLVSALACKSGWATRFDPAATAPGAFTRADGSTCQAPFMHVHMRVTHRRVDDVHLVFLPFSTGRLGMVLALPPAAQPLRTFQRQLDAATWSEWVQDFGEDEGDLALPRFTVRCDVDLSAPLHAMGLQTAFAPSTDFHKVGPGLMRLGAVHHSTLVAVNEDGDASAADNPVRHGFIHHRLNLVFDRPFLAAICDLETTAILWAGYVCAPVQ